MRFQRIYSLSCIFILSACSHQTVVDRDPAGQRKSPVEVIAEPLPLDAKVPTDGEHFDIVVIGAGLGGLASSVYLTDAGKRVLLLEKEDHVGGLAAWEEGRDHLRYDRGAAYWTSAYDEEEAILKHIGLGDFSKKFPIPDPIDSYFVNGKYYSDIWTPKTLAQLPANFAVFKFELERAQEENKIPNQPLEEFAAAGGNPELDTMSARAWVEGMPAALAARLARSPKKIMDKKRRQILEEGRNIFARYKAEQPHLRGATGMEGVLELLDLYCRSALGNVAETVSAMAFANFYISEIETRYTTTRGTGAAASHMLKILRERRPLFQYSVGSAVNGIENGSQSAEVDFTNAGVQHYVTADYVVFAAQLNQAPRLIQGFKERAPEQAALMSSLGYSHYSVHTVEVKGHPYRAAYDTWVHAPDYSPDDFTDVILGLWVDKKIHGYEKYHDFSTEPPIPNSILTIYHPLSQRWLKEAYSDEQAQQLARFATERMERIFSTLPTDLYHGPLQIEKLQTSRWPYSVHIAEPGHYLKKARTLRRPFGRVFFASNNLGTPAFEEALFRGHCAADNVLRRYDAKFKRETWSRCPMDAIDTSGI